MACSAKSPHLIERSSPVLEKARTERAEVVKARRVAVKQRDYDSKYVVNGVDCFKLMKQLVTLPVYGGRKGRCYKKLKAGMLGLVIHRCSGNSALRKAGHWDEYAGEVHLYVTPGWSHAGLREVIGHELLHCASREWPCFRTCKIHHCRHFKSKLKVMWRQSERKLGALDGSVAPTGFRLHNKRTDKRAAA